MAYEFQLQERVGQAIRRVVEEQLGLALKSLHDSKGLDKAVHDARKRLKRARAAMKLVREALQSATYRRESDLLRNIARRLSEVRDAYVMVNAFDALLKQKRSGIATSDGRLFRKHLISHRQTLRRQLIEKQQLLKNSVKAVAVALRRVPEWRIDTDGFTTLRPGLLRAYREGRRAMKQSAKRGRDDDFHEWRKRAKDLRYQLELLSPIQVTEIKALAERAADLGDHLGDDHDLSILKNKARKLLPRGEGQTQIERAIRRRQAELRRKAARLGRKLYHLKPRQFVEKIRNDWKAWQATSPARTRHLPS